MSVLSDNLRYLRMQLSLSQQKIADQLVITRGRYAKYEDGASEPPIEILVRISRFFHVSIDLLVSVDLKRFRLDEMLKLSDNRIILPIKVDNRGENKIEIIPAKASMGYLKGYSDPEYIENLQTISLPFLRNGKYRAFPASGDSMPPFKDGTFIVGKYVESVSDLKKNKTYIFITRNEGIVYKRFVKTDEKGITVSSDNSLYPPYQIQQGDLMEIWEFACSISMEEFDTESLSNQNITELILKLREEVDLINQKLQTG